MKILAVTDVHQMISKWKSLVKACDIEKPDVVAIGGDLFPKDTYITGQMSFIPHLKKYIKKMKDGGAQVVVILGNDDNQNAIPAMEEAHKDGLFHYIPSDIAEIDGYEFVGIPYVPDYPFGYKFWCHPEFNDAPKIEWNTLTGPVEVNAQNEFVEIKNFDVYFRAKKSIYDILVEMAGKVKDIKKSIWLIHAPPSGMGLDICCHGAKVGSDAVLKFINEYQPLLTIHGHIHESPEYNGHKWKQQCDNTLCIQGGQIGHELHYSNIYLDNGKIKKVEHSIYGKKS